MRLRCRYISRRPSYTVAARFIILDDVTSSFDAGHQFMMMEIIKSKIIAVKQGATTSHVRIDLGHGIVVTAAITNEAVAELNLKSGDDAWAVIKASDVMIG